MEVVDDVKVKILRAVNTEKGCNLVWAKETSMKFKACHTLFLLVKKDILMKDRYIINTLSSDPLAFHRV